MEIMNQKALEITEVGEVGASTPVCVIGCFGTCLIIPLWMGAAATVL